MNKTKKSVALNELSRLRKQALELARRAYSEKKKIAFAEWKTTVDWAIKNNFGENHSAYVAFRAIDFKLERVRDASGKLSTSTKEHRTAMRSVAAMLDSLLVEIQNHWPKDEAQKQSLNLTDFWDVLHPKISEFSKSLFETNHYASAVSAALTELEDMVKRKANLADKPETGTKLMHKVFSADAPLLKVPTKHAASSKSIQKGYMFLFAGAMQGIRNPHAHANIELDQEEALHLLFLVSHLMHVLVQSKKET